MTNEEFLEEVLNSKNPPVNFIEIYSSLLEYKALTHKTLVEAIRVCSNNNIRYQMTFGSLLGIVRDGGQIPWDYDEDIMIPFEDREKLIFALNKDLSEDFYYYSIEADAKCPHGILRISPKGYKSNKLHVDVFFVIGVPARTKNRDYIVNRINYLYKGRLYKLCPITKESSNKYKSIIKVLFYRLYYFFISLRRIDSEFISICNENPLKGSIFCTSADRYGKKYLYPTKDMWNLSFIELNGKKYSIPSNYEELLTIWYGDYKSLPPLENRIKEVIFAQKKLSS